MPKSLLSIRHLSPSDIAELLELSAAYKRLVLSRYTPPQVRKVVGLLFFEDSTRTRVSFEHACWHLGLKSCSFGSGGSSMSKGETLKDTILTLTHQRLDGLVMRHKSAGSPWLAQKLFSGPVINGGDGCHEHPTQALADALTILEAKGQLDGLIVAIVGDVDHSRVARSNAWLLSKMGASVRFVGPRTLLPSHSGLLPGEVYHSMNDGIKDADVVMTLRLQKERMGSPLATSVQEYTRMYQVDHERMQLAAPDALLMHPGPINRGVEVEDTMADAEQSAILRQVENGVYVRMAALHQAFDLSLPTAKTASGKKGAAK